MSGIAKMHAKVVTDSMVKPAEIKNFEKQWGYRSNRGCTDPTLVVKQIFKKMKEEKHKTYSAFKGLEKAYDRVNTHELCRVLSAYGMREKFWFSKRVTMHEIAHVSGWLGM